MTRLPIPHANPTAYRGQAAARAHLLSVVARVVAAYNQPPPQAPPTPDTFIDVPDGVMVAFYPPPDLARRLAIAGGEPPEDLHITLALPGKLSSLSPEQKRRLPQIMRGFGLISRPLAGKFNGLTEFAANEGVKPVVLLVDVPGLPAWRQRLVEVLTLNGYTIANDHGFVPHMTLKYAKEDEKVVVDVPTMPLAFDRVCLVMGNRRKEYLLGGNPDVEEPMDVFAIPKARHRPGRKQPRKEAAAVLVYERRLTTDYEDWAGDLAAALAEDPDNADELIAAALLALLLLLRRRGQENLPDAVTLALERAGLDTATATILQRLADAIARNDEYLTNSLMPAIGEKLREMLATGEWAGMQLEGVSALTDWVMGWLITFAGRVASYAGAWWTLNQETLGEASGGKPVVAYLDPDAKHCSECPRFHSVTGEKYDSYESYLGATGGRVPGQFECQGNCRCWLEFDDGAIAAADDLPA